MLMSKINNQLVIISTIALCKELEGIDKTDFIDDIWEHYEHSIFMKHSPKERKRYYELLSELIKTFGH